MAPQVIRLECGDAVRYIRLRRRMLLDAPWSFAASPDDDVALQPDRLAEYLGDAEKAIFAVEAPDVSSRMDEFATGGLPELVAAAGIMRATQRKFIHRARLWGVFVEPDHRGRGLGRLVVSAAIDLARSWPGVDYVDLGVSENAPQAQALYESLGFHAWGREPEATDHDGPRYDEIHMTLPVN